MARIFEDTSDLSFVDEITAVSKDDAPEYACRLHREEGVIRGVPSGAVVACRIAAQPESKGKLIVTALPDGCERYLSTAFLEETK